MILIPVNKSLYIHAQIHCKILDCVKKMSSRTSRSIKEETGPCRVYDK